MMIQKLRGRVRLCVAAIVAVGACAGYSEAVTVELKDVAADRVERQIAAAEGSLPLPGTPDIAGFAPRLSEKGLKHGAPVFIRIFKAESELEVWMQKDGQFVLFASYPICQWSGTIGPKVKEGDRQTPEGFYTVTQRQLHRVGRHPRSLNLGFPNPYDKAFARTGSYILVHGGCSSIGCFAMTNTIIEEIYALTEAAIRGGQEHVPVHVFPFKMTETNLAANQSSEWHEFWSNLKEGYDAFERTRQPPKVSVCDRKYQFQDVAPAPGEGGDPGPLAVCGETLAALEELEQFSSSASHQPSPALSALLSLRAKHQQLLLNAQRDPNAVHPRRWRPGAIANARAGAAGTPSVTCSPSLASCRRHMALLNMVSGKKNSRANRVAAKR